MFDFFFFVYITMELTLEELPTTSLADQFERDISDDSMVINFKYNLDPSANDKDIQAPLLDIRQYVKSLTTILFSSAGIHYNGDLRRPHIHYNFIVKPFKVPSNPSQHRHRWYNKEDSPNPEFLSVTCKFHASIDRTACKYAVLSYPLKEGYFTKDEYKNIYVYDCKAMTKEQKVFLKEVGQAIYEKELGLKQRQEKCEERKKVTLTNLRDLCREHKDEFSSFREMVLWLDINYIAKLEIEDYPDPKNYKTNCQKICVSLGKLKYSDIV